MWFRTNLEILCDGGKWMGSRWCARVFSGARRMTGLGCLGLGDAESYIGCESGELMDDGFSFGIERL